MASITTHESKGEKAGIFPKLLREMLRYLGHKKCPLYKGFKEEANGREEWRVEVHIDTPLVFEAYGRRSTFEAGICDAARQAIFRVRDIYAHELSNTPYRYFPRRRICNTRKKICCYNKHRRQHGPLPIQQQMQIRLTKALDEVCDVALDELRETKFKLREREEELVSTLCSHKAINGNKGVSFCGSCSAITDALPQAQAQAQDRGDRRPPGTFTAPKRARSRGDGGNRRASCSTSLQSNNPAPTLGVPCCRHRLARGGIVNENNRSFGAGVSSIITGANDALPQGQGDRPCPPSTQLSLVMHPAAVAVAVVAPRRDRAPISLPCYEGRVRGKDLVSIISDGGVALGKEPTNANNRGDGYATTSSAPRSSERRRSLL